jgi:hypothetical protein
LLQPGEISEIIFDTDSDEERVSSDISSVEVDDISSVEVDANLVEGGAQKCTRVVTTSTLPPNSQSS